MGIACIRTEQNDQKQPIFIYQNMIHTIKNTLIQKDYQFIQKIGKGSYSQVYKAQSLKTSKTLAIKKIFKKNKKIQQSLLNEFSILKQMDHPNILKMYQLYQDDKNYNITTQLCTGKQLFDVIIQQKSFKQSKAKEIFYQILTAVHYIHSNNIMHRDLKPENIVYDSSNKHVKIIDFGSAIRFQSTDLQTRKVIGTSYYIAPQVLKKIYNHKCDIWSLGIILYILLSGQPPFRGKQDNQILANVMNGPLEFKKTVWILISQNAKDLIRKILNRNPMKRPTTEEILSHRWLQGMHHNKQIKKSNSNLNSSTTSAIQKQQQNHQIEQSLAEVLQNMKKFKDIKSSSIQEGMLVFIVNFIKNNKNQQIQLLKCFQTLDLNNDGKLSLQELKIGIETYLKVKPKQAQTIAQKIFKKVDRNFSGFIDYSQFLVAATNIQLTVSEENLDTAFNYLDEDKNGILSVQEIRKKLGENVSEEKYQKLLVKFDKNNDGLISKEEFIEMMKCLLKM